MMHKWIKCFFIVAFGLVVACEETAVSPTALPETLSDAVETEVGDERHLNISVTEAAGEEFDAAMNLALSLGAEAVPLSVYWDEIETEPGIFNPAPNWLEIANVYFPTKGLQLALTISVIDTNNLRMPSDLADKPFDDPVVVDRFTALLDYVASQVPQLSLTSLAIGNEVDVYLWQDAEKWAAYERFFAETAVHARTLFPEVPIGSKVTFGGIAGRQTASIQSLNRHSDVVLVTYYPLNADFQVRSPTAVHDDFQTLVNTFPRQTIHLLEVGYPSGAGNGSSEAQQAAFIHELFLAWDAHAEQIPVLNYTWLTDMPTTAVTEMTEYYGLAEPGFVSFLATLGLRTNNGEEKPAFTQFASETMERGFP